MIPSAAGISGHADPARAALALCRRHLVAAATFSAFVNLLYIAPTLYMLQVYDRVVPTQGLQTLLFLSLILLFTLASLSLLDRARSNLLVRAGVRLDTALAPLILDATFGRTDPVQARQALREFDGLRGVLSGPAILALFDTPWMPIYILVCALVHPWIGAVALLGCVVLPLIAWANARATQARLERAQHIAGRAYALQESAITASETVRALGMRQALVRRQMRQRETMLAAQTEANFAGGHYVTLTKFIRLGLQSLALGLGAWLAVDRMISPGAIFASSFLIARALAPIEQLIAHWKSLTLARRGYANLRALLASQPIEHARTALPPPKGVLALEGVTVLNPARNDAILHGISFSIAAGEIVAIVGPSGAGKSTLVRAIAGAIVPDRGTIRLDGADTANWDPELLARHIGYLPQDPSLFAGSVSDNIARFSGELRPDRAAVDAAVVAAAGVVGAHGLILGLPGGYDYPLDLGGRGLSAGQSQRVALARAVYGDPALLILDEPNAHLDADGDIQLIRTLQAMKQAGKTVLIVSHKTGVLSVVDRILLLRDGRPALFGPRDEVLAKLAPANARPIPATPISPTQAANQ